MGVDHYENFPVASLLLPARLRPAVREIYHFARTADDIADEGDAPAPERIAALAQLDEEVQRIGQGQRPRDARWTALATVLREHRLPVGCLHDLLSAFLQDARGARYQTREQLLDYCRRSANPVGRLLLALYGRDGDPLLLRRSDGVCTGLQLVNFWQDVALDRARGRVYIPVEDLDRHGLGPDLDALAERGAAWTALMRELTGWARGLLEQGRPLALALGGRIGWELRLVIEGGLRIAERIDAVNGDVFGRRPRLHAGDWALLGARAALWRNAPT